MRLDKFLKVSRIIKRRSVANDACATGHVTINDKISKPGSELKVGDVISITFSERTHKYQVLRLDTIVSKDGACDLYKVVE